MADQIAVISDLHGNTHALDAVLADIWHRGITTIYCLGDLAGKGPDGAAVVDRCADLCPVILRGNWDAGFAGPQENPAVQWWQAELGSERIRYLSSLPNVYDFWLSGKRVRLYHASHISEYHRITSYAPREVHLDMFTNTDFTGFDQPEPDIVGYGDIHWAYMLLPDRGKILFNAGSVGNPLEIPLAAYTILTGDLGSDQPGAFNIEFVRLPYDIEAEIRRAYAVGMPDVEPYAIELRTALYRGVQKKD